VSPRPERGSKHLAPEVVRTSVAASKATSASGRSIAAPLSFTIELPSCQSSLQRQLQQQVSGTAEFTGTQGRGVTPRTLPCQPASLSAGCR